MVTVPASRRQLWRFLGIAKFCHILGPSFELMAKPLYEGLKSVGNEPWLGLEVVGRLFRKSGNQRKTAHCPCFIIAGFKETFWPFHKWMTRDSIEVANAKFRTHQISVAYFSDFRHYYSRVSYMFESHSHHLWLATRSWKVHFGTTDHGAYAKLCTATA